MDSYDEVESGDTVVLGEKVKIVFTAASSLLDIHIEDCFAHNNKYEKKTDGSDQFKTPLVPDSGFNQLKLVQSDCFQTGDKLDVIKEGDFTVL